MARKFMLSLHDFDEDEKEQEAPPPAFTAEELESARADGYARGMDAGIAQTRQQQEETTNALLDGIGGRLETLLAAEKRRDTETAVIAAKIAHICVHKIAPSISGAFSYQDIVSTIESVLDERHDEPRIVVFVHETMVDRLKDNIDSIARARGYGGKAILFSDPALSPADCRVEWADGGVERLQHDITARIEREIVRAISTITSGDS